MGVSQNKFEIFFIGKYYKMKIKMDNGNFVVMPPTCRLESALVSPGNRDVTLVTATFLISTSTLKTLNFFFHFFPFQHSYLSTHLSQTPSDFRFNSCIFLENTQNTYISCNFKISPSPNPRA